MTQKLEPGVVKEWLNLVSGKFSTRDIWQELGIETPEGKSHLRVILFRFEQDGLITSLGTGNYRKVNSDAPKIEWETADPTKTIPLLFPFGEHELILIYPKSIVIVAGSKNAGKTEYLYDFLKLNMNLFIIDLFNSETSPEQMKARFLSKGITPPAPFNVYERYDNYADVINPDHISVIDYLDLNSEVYLVGTEIDAIFRKLKTGVAIIGLQKPPPSIIFTKTGQKKVIERDLAYGGGFTAKRAVLYISMGSNKLKLLYVKTPKQKRVNPNNMTWSFSFDEDGHFTNIQQSYGDELE